MTGIGPGEVGLFVLATALSAAATAAVRAVALRRGLLDHPAPNKLHGRAIPTLGGLAIALPFLGLLWVAELLGASPLSLRELVGLTGAGLVVVLLGIYDDLHGCGAVMKFGVQIVAALVLYGAGFGIEKLTNPLNDAVDLAVLALPVTIFWLVGVTNAINLIDGLDGLASGVVLIAAVTLFVIAVRFDEAAVVLTTLVLAGCILGFLPFNLPPARIFLGDTGSLFLGVTIAAISLLHNRKGALTITLLLPVVLLALPILDTMLAFGRRVLGLRHPFRGDTEHLHHRLLGLGLAPRQALRLFYVVSALLGAAAFCLTYVPKQYTMWAVLVLAFALAALLGALLREERKVVLSREREPASERP
jgi:UDP-GlcNAc:undecaprenyl-phosphate/decaprenyl-phosphate GlcNAc-1-phosphate transferase